LFDHDSAYILQNADRRIVFAIPYEQDFTLIGTTDVDLAGAAMRPAASPAEVDYLCAAVSLYLARSITPADVVWSYSGVRALQDDGRLAAQDASRDYVLARDGERGEPPITSGPDRGASKAILRAVQASAPPPQRGWPGPMERQPRAFLPGHPHRQTSASISAQASMSARWCIARVALMSKFKHHDGRPPADLIGRGSDCRCPTIPAIRMLLSARGCRRRWAD
jgi:hypothetical protein